MRTSRGWRAGLMLGVAAMCCALSVGGCSSWAIGKDAEARKAEAAAARERADESLKDVQAIDAATAAATTVDPATGKTTTDQTTLAAELAKSGRENVIDAVAQWITAGVSIPEAVRAARVEAASENAKALATLRAAQSAQREAESKLAAAKVADARAWDIGGLGIEALAALGLPIAGVLGIYYGRLRGIVTGATQAAQVVGTARALDPMIDDAFNGTSASPQMRALMNAVHPAVKKAIAENKTTPLPGAEAAIAMAVSRADNVGDFDDGLAQRLRELEAEIEALRGGGAKPGAAAAAGV